MIGKIVHGGHGTFGAVIGYANDPKKDARLIGHSGGIFTLSNETMADCFESQARMNPRLGNPMTHLILSFSAHDNAILTDEMMAGIAEEYLRRMGYEDTQYVNFRHNDKGHPHCHIIANRVSNKGKTIKDSNERMINVKVCKELTREYGLYRATGKEAVNERRLRNMEAIRYHMMHYIQDSLRASSTWKEFEEDLLKVGLSFRFRYNTRSHGIEGISFTLDHTTYGKTRLDHDISFSGKKLDQSLTLSGICRQLGNPMTIAHESAREVYEQQKDEFWRSGNYRFFREVDERFPDFDVRYPVLSAEADKDAPSIDGTESDSSDASSDEGSFLQVGLEALGVLIMQPYGIHVGTGGGGSSSGMKWNDEDKKRKNLHNHKRTKSRSR